MSVQLMQNLLRRSIEVVITGRTRNAFVGKPARGFESLLLRQIKKKKHPRGGASFLMRLNVAGFEPWERQRSKRRASRGRPTGLCRGACDEGKAKRTKRACAESLLLRQIKKRSTPEGVLLF